ASEPGEGADRSQRRAWLSAAGLQLGARRPSGPVQSPGALLLAAVSGAAGPDLRAGRVGAHCLRVDEGRKRAPHVAVALPDLQDRAICPDAMLVTPSRGSRRADAVDVLHVV